MTVMGREFELKYRADSGMIAAIRAAFGDFSEIRMETVYYDTLDAALSRRRWMLRRRYENGTSVCTLKTPLPDGSRGEWETPGKLRVLRDRAGQTTATRTRRPSP